MTAQAGSGPAYAAFLEELVRLRTQAGLSPFELAARLGVTENAVMRSESGTRRVGVIELQRWAFACGSTLKEFGRRLEAQASTVEVPEDHQQAVPPPL